MHVNWESERKQLQPWLNTLSEQEPDMAETAAKILANEDPIVVLVFIRHLLEKMVHAIYFAELGKAPKTQPLQNQLQQLNQSKGLPHSVYDTMMHLNRLGTYGAHPKETDEKINQEQVQHALVLLPSVLKWYLQTLSKPLPQSNQTGTLSRPITAPLITHRKTQPLKMLEKISRNPLLLAGWSLAFVVIGIGLLWAGMQYNLRGLPLQALKMEPSALIKVGYQAYQAKDYDLALAYYERCLKLDNRYVAAYNNRALVYQAQNKWPEALSDSNQAIALDLTYAVAYSTRGWTFFKQGQTAQALEDLNQAIQLRPDFRWAWFHRAQIEKAQGDCSKAKADFAKACELSHDEACQATCP
jgi:tetratricopeptide (TPR) repeat protein